MHYRFTLLIALVPLALTGNGDGQSPPKAVQKLDATLQTIRKKHQLPALAAAVVRGDQTVAIGAVGVRKIDANQAVTIDDQFHIGSCTKSMTATLCAMLVHDEKLRWDSQVADSFPFERSKIRAEYRDVTLEQLLSHRSGLPEDRKPDPVIFPQLRILHGPMREQRLKLVELALSQEPAAPVGTKMIYSNYGYVIAGAMAEHSTDAAWEDLIRDRLFKPLHMTTAGFGAPGKAGVVDQPRGHMGSPGALKPIEPGPSADNPACMGPCGTVHCSIKDLAKYASFHLQGAHGDTKLLGHAAFEKLHKDVQGQGYALGWVVVSRDWAGGEALNHSGSNSMNYAVIWLAPEKNFGVVVATNSGQADAAAACDETASELIKAFGTK